jgi:hypothetical protein
MKKVFKKKEMTDMREGISADNRELILQTENNSVIV